MKTIIRGVAPAKSNSYRIARNRLFKTKEMQAFEQSFYQQCTIKDKFIEEHAIHLAVYYDNKRSDLDGVMKGILDCLQKTFTIKNDNKTVIIVAQKLIDKSDPRIEIEIKPLINYDYSTLSTKLDDVLPSGEAEGN